MKYTLSPSNYSFDAAAKTITFSGVVPAHIGSILSIVNVTRGVLYFQPQAGIALSGTYVSPVLTLNCSTGGHSNGDKLVVIYDDSSPEMAVTPKVQLGGGGITATTQRVTLATDGPGVAALSSIDTKTPALVSGRQPVESFSPARTPATTSVASSATSVTVLASNSNRRGVSVFNDSTATLRLSFSTPAAAANAFVALPPGAFLLLDQQLIVTNAIYGIWSSANGTAQVTEYV